MFKNNIFSLFSWKIFKLFIEYIVNEPRARKTKLSSFNNSITIHRLHFLLILFFVFLYLTKFLYNEKKI